MPNTLPLSVVCNVAVSISPVAAASPSFNQGLIVGPSTVIPSVSGLSPRVRQYASLEQMTADGFTSIHPEFLAAGLYFGQTPVPQYLWVGRQDLTAIKTVAVNATAGTNYAVGDVLTVTQSGASLGQVKVATIGTGGAITGLTVVQGGSGYSVASGLVTSGGTGSGALVNITAIGETPLAALQACRSACPNWWACLATGATAADHAEIAAWIQGVTPPSCYFFTTGDTAVLNGLDTNILATLKSANYSRTFGLYATTQGGTYPNNAFAAAAAMGVAMGLNTGLANSNFTMKFKVLAGVSNEQLTQTQVNSIEGSRGNLNLSYANVYSWLEQGTMANGQFLDEVLNVDMLAADIQYSVANLLISQPSVPHTNAGEAQLIAAVNGACDRAASRGFIAPGTWTGQTVLNVSQGTPMPNGYLCQAESFTKQSKGDRAARKAMPIYVTLIEAGSMHSITIGVYVER